MSSVLRWNTTETWGKSSMASANVSASVTNAASNAMNSITVCVPHAETGNVACFKHVFDDVP